MARRFTTNIDLLQFALVRAMMDPVSSDPSGLGTGDAGRIWFNTSTNKLMFWNGTAAIDYSARANHTGTQLASTISDLATTVQAYRLDQFAAPTSAVSMGSQRITNQADPTSAQDSATKNYVDNSIAGISGGLTIKGAVVCAPTTNISLSTPGSTVDGVVLSNPSTILLTGQTTGSQNGPYVWTGASTALTRATNWSTSAQAVLGSFWIVEQGANADTIAILSNDSAITIGTTTPTFVFRGSGGTTYSAGNGLSLASTTFSLNPASGGGLSAASGGASVDSTVARKVQGVIPATTSGIFSVSGSAVTINHALSNSAPSLIVRAYTTPVSGYSQGQLVEMDNVASDANNVVLTLPANPASNNWYVTVIG